MDSTTTQPDAAGQDAAGAADDSLAPLPKRATRRAGASDRTALEGEPTEVVAEILERAAVLLKTLERDVAHLEVDRDEEARRIEDERKRRRAAAEAALNILIDLKARAAEVAKRKGKTLVLDVAMAGSIPAVAEDLRFEDVATELAQEIRTAKGITGAMRLPRIGELLKLATAIVERMVNDADKTKEQLLKEANDELAAESKEAAASFEIGSGILERDLGLLEAYLPPAARGFADAGWDDWAPPATAAASTIRLGAHVHDALPGPVPLVCPFPLERSLLLDPGPHRQEAAAGVQALVLRMIAALPPGALRLTVIDPNGFGESVAALLALGEQDTSLIDGGVASTPDDIEDRLAGLTRHVEQVISQHLRGRHQSVAELNAALGQVVEPYRCLVVFDHPTGLSDTAVRQLHALMETGPRCGVMSVVVRDERPSLYLPSGERVVLPDDLDRLGADAGGFALDVPRAGHWRVRLDAAPPELAARIVAATAREADRGRDTALDLPTLSTLEAAASRARGDDDGSLIDPHDPQSWWRASTAAGMAVPLGRAGPAAVAHLELDGTARPGALVAGRRGLGTSNLLAAFVLGAAMRYHPDELELHLLGFEDQRGDGADDLAPFAEHHLPHAAMVATHAPRELGLSVLSRLADELERRQDLLRSLDLQHEGYEGYRRTQPTPLPRIVLVADRFGTLLAGRDALADQAADQLDRLARLGPHVGIHLVLGTGTDDRAALVTRAVVSLRTRIVLGCTEEESELLLGIGNDEAGRLGAPGDAILSTSLSDTAANKPFRAVLLRPTETDICLGDLRQRADAEDRAAGPQVVDGSAIARLDQRPAEALVGHRDHRYDRLLPRLWLGEPLAVADPVEALVRRQDGANLLVVADDARVGQGVLLSAVTSACLVHGGAVTTLVLDFMPMEEGASEVVRVLAERWPVQLARRRSMTKVLDAVHVVIQDRLAHQAFTAQPVLFVINGLGRARELDPEVRSAEGEHAPLDPAQLLETIVHDGPEVGVHTLIWCDSLTAFSRRTTPGTVREFALRVAGPMSEDHSLTLVDSEVAAGLAPNQAVFYDEDYGRLTRFRPYALPPVPWLRGLVHRTEPAGAAGSPANASP